MDNNNLLQIALIVLGFFVMMKIMNQDSSEEHMDTLLTTPNYGGDVITSAAITPVAANSLNTEQLAATSLATSAPPVVTSAPSAAITGANIPAPLTSVEETLLAAAPPQLPAGALGTENVFSPTPVDMDSLFARHSNDPSDLIPPVDANAEIFSGMAPNPAMNQNFLNNRWSLGIDTSVSKRNPINDLRGMPPNPIAAGFTALFNAPVTMVDVHRKSLCDIS